MPDDKPGKSALSLRVLLVVIVAYFTRLLSSGIHEVLGHGLWALAFGANKISVYVSWLGFGWCKWQDTGLSYTARVMITAGGLLNTAVIGAALVTPLLLVPKKGNFYLRLLTFWLGFWAFITQAGYLFLGGITGVGDPGLLHRLTGTPLSFFVFLGFSLFLLAYFIFSPLFLSEITELFPRYCERVLLFEFWLAVPIQVVFLGASREFVTSMVEFIAFFSISMLPSLVSILFFPLIELAKQKINR